MFTSEAGRFQPPHPKLSPRVFQVVESALRKAWEIVTTQGRPDFDWRRAHEDRVTLELFEALKDRVFHHGLVSGFNRSVFSTIVREPKIRNYNRRKPDKMPDLLIEFADLPFNGMPSQHGIFIECKPVDRDHPVSSHYCGKGLIRFIDGDYAWAMQEAIMLAYAAPDYSSTKQLPKALSVGKTAEMRPLSALEPCSTSCDDDFAEQTRISKHDRRFSFEENDRPAPPITLHHLWLKRG